MPTCAWVTHIWNVVARRKHILLVCFGTSVGFCSTILIAKLQCHHPCLAWVNILQHKGEENKHYTCICCLNLIFESAWATGYTKFDYFGSGLSDYYISWRTGRIVIMFILALCNFVSKITFIYWMTLLCFRARVSWAVYGEHMASSWWWDGGMKTKTPFIERGGYASGFEGVGLLCAILYVSGQTSKFDWHKSDVLTKPHAYYFLLELNLIHFINSCWIFV